MTSKLLKYIYIYGGTAIRNVYKWGHSSVVSASSFDFLKQCCTLFYQSEMSKRKLQGVCGARVWRCSLRQTRSLTVKQAVSTL